MNEKLVKIEMLLSDDKEFEKYINEVENSEISYSNKLEDKILKEIKKSKVSKSKVNYLSAFKMVACMILAIILCQTNYIKNENFSREVKVSKVAQNKETYIDKTVSQISNFLLKPINLEKGEK